jgi:hypothetical protein
MGASCIGTLYSGEVDSRVLRERIATLAAAMPDDIGQLGTNCLYEKLT